MKTAIVTGAGSGIGRAVALRLSADGYRVAVNDIRAAASEGVVAEIRSRKGEAIAVGGDVSKEDDVAAIVATCRSAFGDPTHLINNAGHVHQARFTDITPADFDRMFAVHVRGVFLMTLRGVGGHARARRRRRREYGVAARPDRRRRACPL